MYYYRDFLINTIDSTHVPHVPDETVFNPGMVRVGDKVLFAYRSGCTFWTTTDLYVGELDPCTLQPIGEFSKIDFALSAKEYSIEDPRLFTYLGRPYIQVAVVKHSGKETWVKIGIVDFETKRLTIITNPFDFNSSQKNWCFFEYNKELYCSFSLFDFTHTVCKIEGSTARVIHQTQHNAAYWQRGQVLRGGTNLVFRDGLLWGMGHVTLPRSNNTDMPMTPVSIEHRETNICSYHYYGIFYAINPNPPFGVAFTQRLPMVGTGLEYRTLHGKHLYCLFPTGLIADGNDWIVAAGVNDKNIAILRIPHRLVIEEAQKAHWYL